MAVPGYAEMEAAIFKYIDAMADGMLAAGGMDEHIEKSYQAVVTAFAVAMGKYQRGLDKDH
jgi:hypothetical protein